jgi:PAS domain S-box-containing protein
MFAWHHLSLLERVRRLRYVLPPALVLLVVGYQLIIARPLALYGHTVHYGLEIAFYSFAGPVATWITLVWIEHRLAEKEILERQVRERERHLVSLTDASADAILSLDNAGYIASWNRGAERLFGYAPEAIIGQSLAEILPNATMLFEQLQHEGVVQNFETTALTYGGRPITVNLTQTLLTDDTTETLTSSLIMRDVTARHERDAIVEEERARIARDLHDGVAQVLYLLALKADMAAQQFRHNPEPVMDELKEIGQRTRQVIREIRRTIFALHPLDWSREGFLPSLHNFVKGFAEQLNWQVAFQVDDNLSVPDHLEPAVFRLVQESLNNVAKHAEAKHVWVEIGRENSSLTLVVRDNGLGFDLVKISGSGLGIQQMRQRVETVGGVFRIESQSDQGTTISAQFSLKGGLMTEIRILLADDHAVLRQGIAQALELQPDMVVVAQAQNGLEAVKLAQEHRPNIALLDINMPEMDGVEATRYITSALPETGVIILTMYRRDDYIFEAIKAGANGYLLKEVELDELLRAIRTVARGEAVIDSAIADRVMAELRSELSPAKSSTGERFAERDIEILRLLAQGQSNQEIAEQLFISEKTVRNRLSLIFRRLHLKNRTEAALYAMRSGLVESPKTKTDDNN